MIITSHLLGVLLSLVSAVIYGSGDFSGGLATRRSGPIQALMITGISALAVLISLAFIRHEPALSLADIAWAAGAGLTGGAGVILLYRGLASGSTAIVAPTAAVVGAATPVIFNFIRQGFPTPLQLVGILAGLCGIWMVTRVTNDTAGKKQLDLWLGAAAGIGFGGFFTLTAQIEPEKVFTPLIVVRATGLMGAVLLLLARRDKIPSPGDNPTALLAGFLDASGSVFYMLARNFTRLDIAAVLTSMYPVSTVLLSSLILKEPVALIQWLGVGLCMCGTALIAL